MVLVRCTNNDSAGQREKKKKCQSDFSYCWWNNVVSASSKWCNAAGKYKELSAGCEQSRLQCKLSIKLKGITPNYCVCNPSCDAARAHQALHIHDFIHRFILIKRKIWFPPLIENIRLCASRVCFVSCFIHYPYSNMEYKLHHLWQKVSTLGVSASSSAARCISASDTLGNLSEDTSITRYPRTETSIAYEPEINN